MSANEQEARWEQAFNEAKAAFEAVEAKQAAHIETRPNMRTSSQKIKYNNMLRHYTAKCNEAYRDMEHERVRALDAAMEAGFYWPNPQDMV